MCCLKHRKLELPAWRAHWVPGCHRCLGGTQGISSSHGLSKLGNSLLFRLQLVSEQSYSDLYFPFPSSSSSFGQGIQQGTKGFFVQQVKKGHLGGWVGLFWLRHQQVHPTSDVHHHLRLIVKVEKEESLDLCYEPVNRYFAFVPMFLLEKERLRACMIFLSRIEILFQVGSIIFLQIIPVLILK